MYLQDFNLKSFSVKAFVPLVIILITLFTYDDVRQHEYLNIDDHDYVLENSHVQQGVTLDAVRWAFGFTGVAYWHPLTWISHMVDCRLFGLSSGAHHMVNLALHILNAIFLFLIILRMTGARYKSAIIALLFAVHPLNVESVAWVTERKTVLSALFFMTALYAYIHYAEKKKLWTYLLVLFLFALGLMSKPSIVTFPFLLLILDFWPLGRFESDRDYEFTHTAGAISSKRSVAWLLSFRKSGAIFHFLEKIPFVILSLLSMYLTMISQLKFGVVVTHDLVPLDLRIYNLFVSTMKYLGLLAWPVELSIFYPFPKSIPALYFFVALSSVVLITILALVWRKSRPWFVAGWFWFLISVAPASGLIQGGLWPEMASRFMYLPMIGLFLMLVWEGDARIGGRYARALKVILCCAILIYFISLTKIQNLYFSNSYALFSRSVMVTGGNVIAYNGIGAALISLNRLDEAMAYFEKALAINPKYEKVLNNYGVCLSRKGDYLAAGSYYSQAIAANPGWPFAYLNLAVNQHQRGFPDEAINLVEKALALDPGNGNALNTLGALLMEQGKMEEAIRHFRSAVENKPNLLQARLNLSQAYEKAGHYDEALTQYEALIKIKPADKGITYYRMAGVKSQQERFDDCKNYLESSVKQGFDVFGHLKTDERFKDFRETAIYFQFLKKIEKENHQDNSHKQE
jgi:tetratricopeptide (TPR) repeat protein